MFNLQTDMFRNKQWSGWKYFLNDIIRRESVRTAWQLSKETYDTDFQMFMDRKIAEVLSKPAAEASLDLSEQRTGQAVKPVTAMLS